MGPGALLCSRTSRGPSMHSASPEGGQQAQWGERLSVRPAGVCRPRPPRPVVPTRRLRALTLLSAAKAVGQRNPHLMHKDHRQWVPALGLSQRTDPSLERQPPPDPRAAASSAEQTRGLGSAPADAVGPCGKRLLPRREVCEVFPAAAPRRSMEMLPRMVVESSGQKSVPSTQTPSQGHLFHGPPRLCRRLTQPPQSHGAGLTEVVTLLCSEGRLVGSGHGPGGRGDGELITRPRGGEGWSSAPGSSVKLRTE